MPLAILDHLVLDFSALLEVSIVLVGEAVVPAAVPARGVGVFLIGVGELTAGQLLYVDEAVCVGIVERGTGSAFARPIIAIEAAKPRSIVFFIAIIPFSPPGR